MSDKKIKVGITHGDINGIGYEVILKAFDDSRMFELCTPIIYGSAKIAAAYLKQAQQPAVVLNQIDTPESAAAEQLNIVNVVDESLRPTPGVATKEAGEAAFAALERAVADLRAGEIDVLVTAPISKHSIHSAQFPFPGHTEYLQSSLGEKEDKALMILCNDDIRVALVTIHTPISSVAQGVSREAVLEKLQQFNHSLERDFSLPHPRIAVLALNPHSGEDGLIGSEETDHIIPAIKEAQAHGINCFGPYAADGFFGAGIFKKFDGILAMYHDQGLIPFKTLAMDAGVNFTAGLSFVRTSPDHGTGYDIAGRWEASPESMRSAIYKAIDIYRSRRRHHEAHRNPLAKHYVERNKKDNVVLDLTKSDD